MIANACISLAKCLFANMALSRRAEGLFLIGGEIGGLLALADLIADIAMVLPQLTDNPTRGVFASIKLLGIVLRSGPSIR